jgi:hypothetical protein
MWMPPGLSNMVIIALVPQDGAGRVGKMLFARQGKKFDNDLKQVNMWNHNFFNIHGPRNIDK